MPSSNPPNVINNLPKEAKPTYIYPLIYPGTVLHLPGDGSREKVPGTELTRGRFSIQVFLSILSDQRQVSTLQKVKNQNRT